MKKMNIYFLSRKQDLTFITVIHRDLMHMGLRCRSWFWEKTRSKVKCHGDEFWYSHHRVPEIFVLIYRRVPQRRCDENFAHQQKEGDDQQDDGTVSCAER